MQNVQVRGEHTLQPTALVHEAYIHGCIHAREVRDRLMKMQRDLLDVSRQFVGRLRGEAFEIAARAEHLARAAQQHCADRAIVGASPRRVPNLRCQLEIDSIGGIGPIEGDMRDVIAKFENQF